MKHWYLSPVTLCQPFPRLFPPHLFTSDTTRATIEVYLVHFFGLNGF